MENQPAPPVTTNQPQPVTPATIQTPPLQPPQPYESPKPSRKKLIIIAFAVVLVTIVILIAFSKSITSGKKSQATQAGSPNENGQESPGTLKKNELPATGP